MKYIDENRLIKVKNGSLNVKPNYFMINNNIHF